MASASTPIAKETLDALSAVTPQQQQQHTQQRPSSTVTERSAGHNGSSTTATTSTPVAQGHGRLAQLRDSCDACANSKVKCTGGIICSRCQAKGITCMFSPRRKRGPAKRATRDTALETLSSAAVAAGAATNGENASSSIKRSRVGSVSENTNPSRKHQGDSSGGATSKRSGRQEGDAGGDANSPVPASTFVTTDSDLAVLVQLQREQLTLFRQQTADNQRFQAQLMTMLAVLVGQLAPGSANDSTVNAVPQNIADRT